MAGQRQVSLPRAASWRRDDLDRTLIIGAAHTRTNPRPKHQFRIKDRGLRAISTSREAFPKTQPQFADRYAAAATAAKAIDADTLVSHDLEMLVGQLCERFAAEEVRADFDEIHVEIADGSDAWIDAPREQDQVMRVSLVLPISGCTGELKGCFQESRSGHRGDGRSDIRTVFLLGSSDDSDEDYSALLSSSIGERKDAWISTIEGQLEQANHRIRKHQSELREVVRSQLAPRRKKVLAVHEAARAHGIHLTPIASPLAIPVKPKLQTALAANKAAADGEPIYALEKSIASTLVHTIRSFGQALERQPVVAQRLRGEDEESIRDVLLFILNANWEGQVTGETFQGEGKTDILLRWENRNAFIGECKIWKGEVHFSKGIDQLLGYTVWRDTRAALVVFVKKKDATAILAKARNSVASHALFLHWLQDEDGHDFPDAVLESPHDKQRTIQMSLIPVVLSN